MLLDIHSHREAPYPEGVVSLRLPELPMLVPGQPYSVGIHPWDSDTDFPEDVMLAKLEELASLPQVVAIGECGVDLLKGAPLFRQLQLFKAQVEIAERVGKPLVIHSVKSADIIMGLKRDLRPAQPWVLHGYRGKASAARQLTSKGIYLSYGEKFSVDALLATPRELLLAETDESSLTITDIIARLSEARGSDLLPVIASNVATLLFHPSSP